MRVKQQYEIKQYDKKIQNDSYIMEWAPIRRFKSVLNVGFWRCFILAVYAV